MRLLPPLFFFFFFMCPGIEGGFDVEQEQYEEDMKVVILPDRQEVTSEDLSTMPDVVRERVRYLGKCYSPTCELTSAHFHTIKYHILVILKYIVCFH